MNARRRHFSTLMQRGMFAVTLAFLSAFVPLATQAQTSSQAPVQVDIVETGSLEIGWLTSESIFTVEGDTPSLTAMNPTVTATASFALAIVDTRSDTSRAGFTVQIQSTSFVSEDGRLEIEPSHLWIADVIGVPGATITGRTLDQPITLVSTTGTDPISAEITIVVGMTITPDMRPAAYSGGLSFTVLPLAP